MLNVGGGVDAGPGARGGPQTAREAKIGVTNFNVITEKKAAPNTPEAEAAKQAAEMKKEAEELTQKLITEARDALAKSGEEGRNALKLVTGNEAIVNHLWGQRDAEYFEASKIKDPKVQEQRYASIQKRYDKLIQYAENRQNETKLGIDRLKKSENPKDQALAIDLENANAELDIRSYDMTTGNIQQILKSGINPRTGQTLGKSEIDYYLSKLSRISSRRNELDKITTDSKEAREKMKDADGQPIRSVIDDIATVLGGGKQENSMEFLEQHVAQALASEAGMDKFANELVNIKLLNEGDKKKFIEDMTLGLSWQDRVDMAKKTGGNILMMMMSLSGLLAYVAAQKLREGGGQMVG